MSVASEEAFLTMPASPTLRFVPARVNAGTAVEPSPMINPLMLLVPAFGAFGGELEKLKPAMSVTVLLAGATLPTQLLPVAHAVDVLPSQ